MAPGQFAPVLRIRADPMRVPIHCADPLLPLAEGTASGCRIPSARRLNVELGVPLLPAHPTPYVRFPMRMDTAPLAAPLLRAERWVGAMNRNPSWGGANPRDPDGPFQGHRQGMLRRDEMSNRQKERPP